MVRESSAAQIHQVVLRILRALGAIVGNDDTRKLLVHDHGCLRGDDGRIRFPEDLVERSLETVPSHITSYDQNGDLAVGTTDRIARFSGGHNCVQGLDFETSEYHPATLEDIEKAGRVQDARPNIDALASLGYASDVPVEDEAWITVKALVENSNAEGTAPVWDHTVDNDPVRHYQQNYREPWRRPRRAPCRVESERSALPNIVRSP